MIQKNPFLKYLIKDEKEDIFHSSAHAKVHSGAAMGAASTESFAERMKVDRNRQVVRGYGDSRVMTEVGRNALRAKVYTPAKQGGASGGAGVSSVSSVGASDARRIIPKRPGISIK